MAAEYTENLGLKKPAQEDFYDVDDFNGNADIIDKIIAQQEQKINEAAYIKHDNGINKYRFGVDEIGVYFEVIDDEEGDG